jgi:hypothetical protein
MAARKPLSPLPLPLPKRSTTTIMTTNTPKKPVRRPQVLPPLQWQFQPNSQPRNPATALLPQRPLRHLRHFQLQSAPATLTAKQSYSAWPVVTSGKSSPNGMQRTHRKASTAAMHTAKSCKYWCCCYDDAQVLTLTGTVLTAMWMLRSWRHGESGTTSDSRSSTTTESDKAESSIAESDSAESAATVSSTIGQAGVLLSGCFLAYAAYAF